MPGIAIITLVLGYLLMLELGAVGVVAGGVGVKLVMGDK